MRVVQFRDDRVPSFFSIDEDARVLRFDSMSKILCPGALRYCEGLRCVSTHYSHITHHAMKPSPGLRIGFVSGPKELVAQINLHSQASCLHTSGLSQAIVLAFFRHLVCGGVGH